MKFYKRLATVATGVVLAASSIMGIGFAPLASAASGSDTCTWTGATDNKFSTATNWTGCSGAAPVNNDAVVFPSLGSITPTLTNDLDPSVAFSGVTIGSAGATDYTSYTIDKLHLADGATITTLNDGEAGIGISGSVTADGGLVFDGRPAFSPVGKNIIINFTNLTYNNAPMVCGGGASEYYLSWLPSGKVTVGSGSYYHLQGTEGSVEVKGGGALELPSSTGSVTYAGNITFDGGGSTQGTICGQTNQYSLNTIAKNTTLSGKITLAGGDILYNIADEATLTLTGSINGSGSALKAYKDSKGTLVNKTSSDSSDTPEGSTTTPIKYETISDKQPTKSLSVAAKTVVTLDGSRDSVYVDDNGTLKGNGSVNSLNVYGVVAPGHSPGKLTVVNTLALAGGSIYQAELKDSKAGDYDQLSVTGKDPGYTVDNYVTLGDFDSSDKQTGYPTLDVSLYEGYSIKKGDKFTIIDNKSKTDVKGIFKDLKEGATLTVKNVTFKISYKGGDGNDVVLTAEKVTSLSSSTTEAKAPKAPDTGFALTANHTGFVLGAIVLIAGAIAAIAGKSRKLSSKR